MVLPSMNARFKKLFADNIVLASFISVFAMLVFYVIFLLVMYQKLPPVVPLFNQVPWGEARLATKMQLFIPFGIVCAIVIGNTGIVIFFSSEIPLITRLVSLTNFLITLFALLLMVRTVLILI